MKISSVHLCVFVQIYLRFSALRATRPRSMTNSHWRRQISFKLKPLQVMVWHKIINILHLDSFFLYFYLNLMILTISHGFFVLLLRMGGGDPVVWWRKGLVPQNICGGNNKSQRAFAKPSGEYSCQVRHPETRGRASVRAYNLVHPFYLKPWFMERKKALFDVTFWCVQTIETRGPDFRNKL